MRRSILVPTFVLGISALIAVWTLAKTTDDEFPDISIADLKAAIADNKVTLLDVNGTRSWNEGHIPGAIDYQANKATLANVLPAGKDGLIVAYCGGPSCGAYKAAAKDARKLGYTNIRHFSAGIQGWRDAEEPTEKGS